MTFGVLYIDEGNFLNWYSRREEAEAVVLAVARRDPAEAHAFGYLPFDEAGELTGAFVSGATLLEHAGDAINSLQEVRLSAEEASVDTHDMPRNRVG